MPDLQPLSSEEDILNEAKSVPQPQVKANGNHPDFQASQVLSKNSTSQAGTYQSAPKTMPESSVAFGPVSPLAYSSTNNIDPTPFRHALPVQNYVISTISLVFAGIWGLYLSVVFMANMRSTTGSYGRLSGNELATMMDTLLALLPLVIFIVLGVSLLNNKKPARFVALGAASLGVIYWSYLLIQYMQIGLLGFALFGLFLLMVIIFNVLPLTVMIFTIIHLLRPKVAAAYR